MKIGLPLVVIKWLEAVKSGYRLWIHCCRPRHPWPVEFCDLPPDEGNLPPDEGDSPPDEGNSPPDEGRPFRSSKKPTI